MGELIIGSFENKLCLCDWRYRKMRTAIDNRLQTFFKAKYKEEKTDIIEQTILELSQYFQKQRNEFNIPLIFAGTDFQQIVWNALMQIPYGSTASYIQLSEKIGNKNAVRAVAAANGANAISIIVPCHRIIGSDGKLVGYAGGLPAKKKLLLLERKSLFTDI